MNEPIFEIPAEVHHMEEMVSEIDDSGATRIQANRGRGLMNDVGSFATLRTLEDDESWMYISIADAGYEGFLITTDTFGESRDNAWIAGPDVIEYVLKVYVNDGKLVVKNDESRIFGGENE